MTAKPCCPPGVTLPLAPVVPAWANPRLAMATTAWKVEVVPLNPAAAKLVAAADPKRLAVGFNLEIPEGSTVRVAPHTRPDLQGWTVGSINGLVWLDLFTYGPLVCAGWTAMAFTGASMWVYQVYQLR